MDGSVKKDDSDQFIMLLIVHIKLKLEISTVLKDMENMTVDKIYLMIPTIITIYPG